ncbi:MAG: hypothetical protein JXR15_13090 [Shimia sp.]|uniref:hypothetical protein n=1 Tax=Shimia sp. TaxID=1954381 RepID=UPI003B8BF577
MTNPFADPAPAPSKKQGMSARDKALVGAITDAMLKHHVAPLADRVAHLETLLAAEQEKVATAIRDSVSAYLGDTDDDATKRVKAAMTSNPDAYGESQT